MPLLEEGLINYLLAQASLTGLVDNRIYPLSKEQDDDLPAITYQSIETLRERVMEGTAGIVQTRMQIDSWGRTLIEAKELAEKVRICLDGYSGDWSGIRIQGVFQISQNDIPEAELAARLELDQDRIIQDFYIWWNEERIYK